MFYFLQNPLMYTQNKKINYFNRFIRIIIDTTEVQVTLYLVFSMIDVVVIVLWIIEQLPQLILIIYKLRRIIWPGAN